MRTRFRSAVRSFASTHQIPVVEFAKHDRKQEVMAPHIARQAKTGVSGVAAIGFCPGGPKRLRHPRRDRVHRADQRVRHLRGSLALARHLRPPRTLHYRGVPPSVDEPATAAPDPHQYPPRRVLVGGVDASHSPPSPTMAGGRPHYGSEILGSWPCSAPSASP